MTVSNEKFMATMAMAGRVKRYHTIPTLHRETVAEHSWRVATLYIQLFGTPRAQVLEFALHHDCGELWAGDVPHHAKVGQPVVKQVCDDAEEHGLEKLGIQLPLLTVDELHRLKMCDLLQMLEFATIEQRMGNTYAQIVSEKIIEALKRMDTEGTAASAAVQMLSRVA